MESPYWALPFLRTDLTLTYFQGHNGFFMEKNFIWFFSCQSKVLKAWNFIYRHYTLRFTKFAIIFDLDLISRSQLSYMGKNKQKYLMWTKRPRGMKLYIWNLYIWSFTKLQKIWHWPTLKVTLALHGKKPYYTTSCEP